MVLRPIGRHESMCAAPHQDSHYLNPQWRQQGARARPVLPLGGLLYIRRNEAFPVRCPRPLSLALFPSGLSAAERAEVTIPVTSSEKVKTALATEMLNRGWRLVKDSGLQISFEHPVSGIVPNLLFSTPAGGAPVERVSFAVLNNQEITRLVAGGLPR
jgi:hypothetical protein